MLRLTIGPITKRTRWLEPTDTVVLWDGTRKPAAELAVGDCLQGWGGIQQIEQEKGLNDI